MKEEDKLYRLIASLNASEKGFFKKTSNQFISSENPLIFKLFDIYNKFNFYDEEKIEKALKAAKFGNQIHKLKSELHQAILDSLKLYYKNETVTSKIRGLLEDANVLERKMLYSDVKSKIAKAKKLASEYEIYIEWLNVIHREKSTLASFHPNPKSYEKKIAEIYAEEERVLEYKKLDTELVKKHIEIIGLITSIGSTPFHKIQEKCSKLSEALNYNFETLSPRSKINYQCILVYKSIIDKNEKEFNKSTTNLCELMFSKETEYCLKPIHKISHLNNTVNGFDFFQNIGGIHSMLNTMKKLYEKIPANQKDDKKHANNIFYYLNIGLYVYHHEFEKGLELALKKLKEENIDYKNQIIDSAISLYFDLGLMYTGAKRYKEAIKTLQQLYLKTNKDFEAVTEAEIIFLLVLCHLKLNQPDSIEVLVKDYLKIYERNNLQLPLRKKMMDFVNKNPYLNSEKIINEFIKITKENASRDFTYNCTLIDLNHWVNNH